MDMGLGVYVQKSLWLREGRFSLIGGSSTSEHHRDYNQRRYYRIIWSILWHLLSVSDTSESQVSSGRKG